MIRFLLLLVSIAPVALAQPNNAVDAYKAGQFSEAATLTETNENADDLAFAARSVLAACMASEIGEPAIVELKRAEALARQAIQLDEVHVEARLQLAIALSLQARPLSNRQAMRAGLGQKARALADIILDDDPDNVYAHGLLAVWNIEVLRRGGRIGAAMIGASQRAGFDHYAKAVALAPDNGALHWQWARVLAATNAKAYREHIAAALDAAIAANTDDALEAVMQARALRFKQEMRELNYKEVEALAASLL